MSSVVRWPQHWNCQTFYKLYKNCVKLCLINFVSFLAYFRPQNRETKYFGKKFNPNIIFQVIFKTYLKGNFEREMYNREIEQDIRLVSVSIKQYCCNLTRRQGSLEGCWTKNKNINPFSYLSSEFSINLNSTKKFPSIQSF